MTSGEFELRVYCLRDKLFRFANRLMNDSDDALDIIQDTMLKLWNKRAEIKKLQNVEAYAFTLTKNKCYDKLRHNQLRQNKKEELMEHWNNNVKPINEEVEKLNMVKQIIDQLPEIQKMIIHLRDIEEQEIQTIASVTGLNESAIRTNLSRARKKVREETEKIYAYGLNRIEKNSR